MPTITITSDPTRCPYIGSGDWLPYDHPSAERIRAAGDAAAKAMAEGLDGLDGLARVGSLIVYRSGGSVWMAEDDARNNQVRWRGRFASPRWSARAVQTVGQRRSVARTIHEHQLRAEAAEWMHIVADLVCASV